jgi:hypothetical protein
MVSTTEALFRNTTMYTVMLKDESTGTTDCLVVNVGDMVTIDLHDENGMSIQKIGVVDEILEDNTNYESSLSFRMNTSFNVVNDAYVIANVNMGLNAYDTLCLICAELNININNVDDSDFDSCSIALENFCNGANDETGYTVSVWFDNE